ncbi:MAG: EAL domain-containing protein, partial [Lachnospiraceae bacterium]|nr:EAL domain-containing protein [Lachnospiraceae bacterium]
KKMTHGTENKVFLIFLMVGVLSAILSLSTVIRGKYLSEGDIPFMYLLNTAYFIVRNFTGVIYMLYIIAITDTWHKWKYHKGLTLILVIPYFMELVLLFTNPYTHWIFYYDDNYRYVRGDFFFILYIAVGSYLVCGIAYLIKYRKLVRLDKSIALISLVPFTCISIVIQLLVPTLLVEMLGGAIVSLIMMIMVQRPEDFIDTYTDFKKGETYKQNMERNYLSGKHVDVIILNIDNFESVLTILGHESERFLLKKLAEKIESIDSSIKHEISSYHLGKGKFRLIIKENLMKNTVEIADRLNESFRENFKIKELEINLIATICIVKNFDDIEDYTSFIQFDNEIDKIIPYSGQVKFAGMILSKDNVYLAGKLYSIIENAIANNYFEVYYQPIYSIKDNEFHSAEALLRLKDPDYGFISPELFIPAAEKSGAIHKIGEFVLEEVCSFIASKEFEKTGLQYIEINLSVAQCMQSEMAETIINIMDKYGISSDKINLEITETAASYAQNVMMDNLETLIQKGVSFSLDDYGTGYSNIKRVASLPVNLIKLDKTFVNTEDNPKLWIILKNTVQMIKEMDLKILIEGVETESMVEKFSELECEYIQGYYYSKPIPKSEFIDFMIANK